ncbi:hypothetical protein IAD21_06267 [Abditibacteriota bacterium]|nr:hypothetical protein IAD21_06267 [Abditibacteriota bacterium]
MVQSEPQRPTAKRALSNKNALPNTSLTHAAGAISLGALAFYLSSKIVVGNDLVYLGGKIPRLTPNPNEEIF